MARFGGATADLWHNFKALFTPEKAEWGPGLANLLGTMSSGPLDRGRRIIPGKDPRHGGCTWSFWQLTRDLVRTAVRRLLRAKLDKLRKKNRLAKPEPPR